MIQGEKKTGVVYCRVSSQEQVNGTSLEMQERYCKEYAERQGIDVVAIFVEKGESAKTTDRTEFIKAIAFCCDRKKKVDCFIVYKLDRFARNQADHFTVRANLKRFGTELRSVTEPINNTPAGQAMEGMIAVFAEFDNNVRTERTVGGMKERLRQGVWVWPAPIGFYRPYKGANIAPDPSLAPYIKLIFEEYAKGIYSYDSLAKFVAERGFRTRHGKQPFPQLIEKIIKNPIYYGKIDALGIQTMGSFDPIVPEELFERCQNGYKGKARFTERTTDHPDFPLRRTKCAVCGNSLTASYSKSGKYPYYHHQRQNCPLAKYIPQKTFEQLFVEYLNQITPSPKYERLFKAVMVDIWKSNYAKFDEENSRINREIERLQQDRQKIFESHRSGAYSDEEFLEQKDLINKSIDEKRRLLRQMSIEEFDMEAALGYCFDFVRNTSKSWLRLGYRNKLRLQNNIFPERTTFDGKKFGTKKLARVYALNQESKGKKSNLVPLTGFEPVFLP